MIIQCVLAIYLKQTQFCQKLKTCFKGISSFLRFLSCNFLQCTFFLFQFLFYCVCYFFFLLHFVGPVGSLLSLVSLLPIHKKRKRAFVNVYKLSVGLVHVFNPRQGCSLYIWIHKHFQSRICFDTSDCFPSMFSVGQYNLLFLCTPQYTFIFLTNLVYICFCFLLGSSSAEFDFR